MTSLLYAILLHSKFSCAHPSRNAAFARIKRLSSAILSISAKLEFISGKKEAIAEQLRLGQELRRKVDRVDTVRGSDDESASGSDSSGSDSEDGGPREANGLTKKAAKKVQKAATGILEGSELF